MKQWSDLPEFMQIPEVKPYWESLWRKRLQLAVKRCFDFVFAVLLLLLFAVPMAVIAVWIRLDSPGPVFFRQERVTANGKVFRIHKFRTMIQGADRLGSGLTTGNDSRVTRAGKKLRSLKLDELPQLFDVMYGDMSFVGTRPETVQFVKLYQKPYLATLLLPAGITSEASIQFRNENDLFVSGEEPAEVYLKKILPEKMKLNLEQILKFSLSQDLQTMIRTVFAVGGK